ncbi:MAG: hypothetical protein M3133_01810 [Actinomycetota bacterium]|nr:hypothetical protein [Actinomycetota bacterium]
MHTDDLVPCPRCGAMRPAWAATPGEKPLPREDATTARDDRLDESPAPPPQSRTPPGALVLPTFGSALKQARGGGGTCECGRRRLDARGHPIDPHDD